MTLENNGHWYDGILNSKLFAIDPTKIKSIGGALGYNDNDGDLSWKLVETGNDHQYYNSAFFGRIGWPLGVFGQIRWAAKDLGQWPKWIPFIGGRDIPQFIQFGIGYKLNGRFAIHLRPQSDRSNAQPQHPDAPNNGHAMGFDLGGK